VSTPPKFVSDDSQEVTQELIDAWEAMTGKTLYPAQIERLFIDLMAYRETLVRSEMNDVGRLSLPAFSRAPILDYLGELVGVTRLGAQSARTTVRLVFAAPLSGALVIPAGLRAETAGGVRFKTASEARLNLDLVTLIEHPEDAHWTEFDMDITVLDRPVTETNVQLVLDPSVVSATNASVANAIAAHATDPNAHAQYVKLSQKGQAGGVVPCHEALSKVVQDQEVGAAAPHWESVEKNCLMGVQ
jgi:hypothetical protein